MIAQKIRYPNTNLTSWTAVDQDFHVIPEVRAWVIHLEQINYSPNTIKAYLRHVVSFGNYLNAHGLSFAEISISNYDNFLLNLAFKESDQTVGSPNNLISHDKSKYLSSSKRNQIHLAIKCFYRFLNSGFEERIAKDSSVSQQYSTHRYKPFLEHISSQRPSRPKDQYLSGDIQLVQRRVTQKRLLPGEVIRLIEAAHLIRDSFLITLLYTTGMRIGEAIGLHHGDIDLNESVVWVIPRDNNENGARAKSQKSRSIPVPTFVVEMYEDFITDDEYAAAFETGTDYVFCNLQSGSIGRALSFSYVNKLRLMLIKRSGIQFTWHMFRHTHASEAIASGYSLLQVADRLGHSSPQTTADFYRHLFCSEIRELHLEKGTDSEVQQYKELQQKLILSGGDPRWV